MRVQTVKVDEGKGQGRATVNGKNLCFPKIGVAIAD